MAKTGRVKHPPNPWSASSPPAAGPAAARGALSPFAQGGKIARRGFRYQDRWVLIQLSRWLGETGFGGYRNEGADDVEAWWNVDGQPRFERFQLKDTKIDKATLAEILQGFEADDARFPGQWKMFRLIASACTDSLAPLPSELESLRNCFETYTAASAYYQDALNTFKQRLAKLGITADAQFLCERVTLELDETIPRREINSRSLVNGNLLSMGVRRQQLDDAVSRFSDAALAEPGKKVTAATLRSILKPFLAQSSDADVQVSVPPSVTAAPAPAPAQRRVPWVRRVEPVGTYLRVTTIPGQGAIIELPDGSAGLVDCDRSAVPDVLALLKERKLKRLAFIAISHWHFDHYSGFVDILNAVKAVEKIFIPDPDIIQRGPHARRHLASPLVRLFAAFDQHPACSRSLRYLVGAPMTFGFGNPDDRIEMTMIAPPWLRFLNQGGPGDYPNDLCSIFHWKVGRSAFLYTGDITPIGWRAIRDAADRAKLDLRCDIFTVPHSGSQNSSLSPEFLKSIRRGDDLVALVRPRERYGLPRREAMDMLRKAKVQIEVARERPLSILLDQKGIHVE